MDIIITKRGLLRLSVFVLWTAGLIDGSDVTQTDILWKDEGEDATINCSHTKDGSYFQMYWYRQLPGETMKLIVFTTTTSKDHDFGDFSKEKFSATKPNTESGTFTVKNLVPEDKGLYFCAVSGQGGAEAYFGQGTKLTVLEPDHTVTEPKVTVLRPSQKECRNPKNKEREKTIVCVASKFYPDHVSVSWTINGFNVREGVATDNAALRVGKYYRITSRLRVAAETWYNPSIKFTCIVTFYNVTNTDYPAHIYGETAVGDGMTRDKYLRITQTAKLSYGVFIIKSCIYGAFVSFLVWKLQGSAGKQHN